MPTGAVEQHTEELLSVIGELVGLHGGHLSASTLGDELAAKASSSSLEHQIELRCTKSEVKTIVAEAIDGLKTELRAEFSAALEAKARAAGRLGRRR